jgi:glycosyltransferase involved in cell wall biosynthesis
MNSKILIPWYKFPPFSASKISGISISVWELATKMAQHGFDVDVLVGESAENEQRKEFGSNLRIVDVDLGRKLLREDSLAKDDLHLLEEYDYVLSIHNYGARALAPFKQRIRLIRQIHAVFRIIPFTEMVYLNYSLVDLAKAFFLKRRQTTKESLLRGIPSICISQHLREKMIEQKLETEEHLYKIPLGIDSAAFRPSNVEKQYDCIFAGGFHKIKGIDLLFDALAYLFLKNGKTLRVAIAGNFCPKERNYLLGKIPKTVRGNVTFLGVVPHEEMPEIINSSKIAIVPSRYESFSIFSLESLACGIPVVASNVAALPEIIDSRSGMLFEPLSIQSLARSIETVLNDPLRQDGAFQNSEVIARRFDWKVIIQKFKLLFETLALTSR